MRRDPKRASLWAFLCLAALYSLVLAAARDAEWTTTYPFGGIIHSAGLVVDPAPPNVVYAAPQWRGIYRSDDYGASWTNMLDADPDVPFDRMGIRFLAIHPKTAALYVVSQCCGTSKGRLFRSDDPSDDDDQSDDDDPTARWTALGASLGVDARIVGFDPADASRLFLGTADARLLLSLDDGMTWSDASVGLPASEIRSLAFDPGSPGTMYLGTATAGIFKSTDGGQSWAASNSNVTMTAVDDIEIDPSSPQTVYAANSDRNTLGIFKSMDGGQSWVQLVVLDNRRPRGGAAGYLIAVDPLTPSNLYAFSNGQVARSIDGGVSWSFEPVSAFQVRALAIHPAVPHIVYAGTGGDGVIRSTDRGQTWTNVSTGIRALNFSHSRAHGLLFDPFSPGIIYAGSTSDGTGGSGFRSTDGGRTWARMTVPSDSLSSLGRSGSGALAFHSDLWRSADDGVTWTNIMPAGFCCFFIDGDVVVAPNDPQRVYLARARSRASPDGVFRSDDGGATWTSITAGLANPAIHTLAVDPNNRDVVYAGTSANSGAASALYKSVDSGMTWMQLGGGLPSEFNPNQIVLHPLNSDLVYMGGETTNGGVYKSTDGGVTWLRVLAENVNAVASAGREPGLCRHVEHRRLLLLHRRWRELDSRQRRASGQSGHRDDRARPVESGTPLDRYHRRRLRDRLQALQG